MAAVSGLRCRRGERVNRPISIHKIQSKTIDLSTRLREITTEFVGFIPQSLLLRTIVLGWSLLSEIGLSCFVLTLSPLLYKQFLNKRKFWPQTQPTISYSSDVLLKRLKLGQNKIIVSKSNFCKAMSSSFRSLKDFFGKWFSAI